MQPKHCGRLWDTLSFSPVRPWTLALNGDSIVREPARLFLRPAPSPTFFALNSFFFLLSSSLPCFDLPLPPLSPPTPPCHAGCIACQMPSRLLTTEQHEKAAPGRTGRIPWGFHPRTGMSAVSQGATVTAAAWCTNANLLCFFCFCFFFHFIFCFTLFASETKARGARPALLHSAPLEQSTNARSFCAHASSFAFART